MLFTLADAVAVLERTPLALRALLAGLSRSWTDATEGPGTWSPHVVVAHLRHADRTNWIVRARTILEHGEARAFPAFDRDGQFADGAELPLPALLDDFARVRRDSLLTLGAWHLDHTGLARTGTHPALGRVMLRQLLAAWVAHDLSHLAQISRVMARHYGDDVGPWRTYLPIMER
jgi:hypothetical protein